MSERTAEALARLDQLLTLLKAQPANVDRSHMVEEAEHLRRAIDAFHMEAIRFRMYSVERHVKNADDPSLQRTFDDLRQALEAAGFHTRSHAAP